MNNTLHKQANDAHQLGISYGNFMLMQSPPEKIAPPRPEETEPPLIKEKPRKPRKPNPQIIIQCKQCGAETIGYTAEIAYCEGCKRKRHIEAVVRYKKSCKKRKEKQ